jgi:3-hydroxyacyl-CoA dehydrogenase
MGTGIGIVASRTAGLNVKFVEAREDSTKRSSDFVNSWIEKEISKEKMNQDDKKSMLAKISYHNSISALNDVDFAIEVNLDFVYFEGR